MLLTNQKTINYEIYIKSKETTFHFMSAKVANKSIWKLKKKFNTSLINSNCFNGYFSHNAKKQLL
jgi:hypothetical protein